MRDERRQARGEQTKAIGGIPRPSPRCPRLSSLRVWGLLPERAQHYLVLLAAGLILFLSNLGGPSLWDLDEGRNATAAIEMMESGNFVVPTFNGQLRVDKPILLYWLLVASFQAFGINEFAARFPSALAALATLFCCYELGRALFRPSTALLGGLILGSTAMMVGAGRFANPDAVLDLFIVLMLTLFWLGHRRRSEVGGQKPEVRSRRSEVRPRASWFIGIGIVLGLGSLTKGPVGVLLPGLVVLAYLAWEKRLAVLWDRRLAYGVLALALVALPWYIWVTALTRGSFLQGFLWEHNLSRFLIPINNHNGTFLYYLLVLLVGLAPWSLFIFFASWYGAWSMARVPWAFGEAWWRKFGERGASQGAGAQGADLIAAAYRFLGVWLACYLVFFSVAATKLPNYLLPAAVPCALLIARFLDRWRLGELQLPRWIMPACLGSMAAVGIATGLGLAFVSGRLPFEPCAGPFAGGLEYWSLVGLVPVAAALVGALCLRRNRANGFVLSLILGTSLFLAPLSSWALPAWNMIKAPRSLVEEIGAAMPTAWGRSQDIRIGAFHLEHLPSLNFYTQREVMHQGNEAEALAFLHYQVPVYLFLPAQVWHGLQDRAPATCRLVAIHPDLYRSSDIVVVANGWSDKKTKRR